MGCAPNETICIRRRSIAKSFQLTLFYAKYKKNHTKNDMKFVHADGGKRFKSKRKFWAKIHKKQSHQSKCLLKAMDNHDKFDSCACIRVGCLTQSTGWECIGFLFRNATDRILTCCKLVGCFCVYDRHRVCVTPNSPHPDYKRCVWMCIVSDTCWLL